MKFNLKTVLFLVLVSFFNFANAGGTKSMDLSTSEFTSKYDFDTSVARIQSAVKSKGMLVFAVIDHKKAAKDVGLDLRPTKVIIFGAPKAGTPLMEKAANLALFLPLKALVVQDGKNVKVVMENPKNFAKALNIKEDLVAPLAKATKLIQATVTK